DEHRHRIRQSVPDARRDLEAGERTGRGCWLDAVGRWMLDEAIGAETKDLRRGVDAEREFFERVILPGPRRTLAGRTEIAAECGEGGGLAGLHGPGGDVFDARPIRDHESVRLPTAVRQIVHVDEVIAIPRGGEVEERIPAEPIAVRGELPA